VIVWLLGGGEACAWLLGGGEACAHQKLMTACFPAQPGRINPANKQLFIRFTIFTRFAISACALLIE
jgi:hypothetical protein